MLFAPFQLSRHAVALFAASEDGSLLPTLTLGFTDGIVVSAAPTPPQRQFGPDSLPYRLKTDDTDFYGPFDSSLDDLRRHIAEVRQAAGDATDRLLREHYPGDRPMRRRYDWYPVVNTPHDADLVERLIAQHVDAGEERTASIED